MSPFDFTGQSVFVAGGTSGINLGIADAFAARGARVCVLSRSADKVDAAARHLGRHGGEAFGFSADVRDGEAVSRAFADAAARFGDIDVLVSGAAGNFPAPVLGMSSNAFRSVVDIDLIGAFHVLKAAHLHLKKPGASVITVSAPQAVDPMPFQAHVCAAKAGADMLMKTLAIEWAPDGIRLNAIIPGPIDDTEGMKRLAAGDAARERVRKSVPMQRFGSAAEVGDLALFLASPMSAYITGAVIPCDGGLSVVGGFTMAQAMLGT
jgi:NAD(P)-dependent dehydrogenase (short-subunit alcohol dehydrogenase family)